MIVPVALHTMQAGALLKGHASKTRVLVGTVAVALACVGCVVLSLRNDDSTLSVVARYLRNRMGWSADSATVDVLRRMERYEKQGRDDDAIRTGAAWAEKYPDSSGSSWIYPRISALCVKRARNDSGRAEEYLRQALMYREKALPSASDSPYSLQQWVTVSESVGDLSASQRCVQYRNTIKLLDRMNLLVNENKDRVARQFKPDPEERRQLEGRSEWIGGAIKRLGAKLSTSGCQ